MMFTPHSAPRRSPWARRLAALLTFALAFPPLSGLLPAAQAQTVPIPASMTPGGIKSILVFPAAASTAAATAAGDASAALTAQLDAAIKLRLTSVNTYTVVTYTKFLPAVQRGLIEADADNGLTDADVKAPFGAADLARAKKIAALVGTDAFLLTTIASYDQDATSRRVTLLVNSRLYDSRTGDAVPGMGGTFSGAAAPITASDTDAAIQQGAVNDAAGRIVSSLNAASPRATRVASNSQRGSDHGAQTALIVIIGAALLAAIISGSHFGGGGGGGGSSSSSSSSSNNSGSPPGPPGP